ncbi:MAG: hypothetical protein HW412_899 [Bacteroidetes bacterium]|nr:hypothetical protein [Bacteroidota bacterium]
MRRGILVLLALVSSHAFASLSPKPVAADSQLSSRFALSGGMGVEYISVPDVVDFINASIAVFTTQRVSEFKSSVQFFGALAYPLSEDWVLKGEYAYVLVSYAPNIPGRSSEFTLAVHMPSLVLQYVLWDERLYNIKAGIGFGYHVASLVVSYPGVDNRLTGKGIGSVIDLEANTAFGDHLFAYLGADLRWEFIGKMDGRTQGIIPLPTGNAFSTGARLGFSYYF